MKKFFNRMYGRLGQRRWIGGQIRELYHIYEMIRPADEITMKSQAMKLYIKTLLLSVCVFFLGLYLLGPTIYHIIMVFTLVFLFRRELIRRTVSREELKLLKQLEKYLSHMRHAYNRLNMVEEAIYESMEQADCEIALHMERIYDILTLGDDADILQYKETSPNKFFTVFLALCRITVQYGDTKREEVSLFLSNLNQLRNEINAEVLKREKINHVFSGLVFVTIFPVFFLKTIEDWGISGLPELVSYYRGSYGILMSIVIFLMTLLSYSLITRLSKNSSLYRPKHPWLEWLSKQPLMVGLVNWYLFKRAGRAYRLNRLIGRTGENLTLSQFLIQRVLIAAGVFLASMIVLGHTVIQSKWNVIHDTRDFRSTDFISSGLELAVCQDIVKGLSERYKRDAEIRKSMEAITAKVQKNQVIRGEKEAKALAEEIIRRVEAYQGYTYHWFYPLLALAAAVVISYFPLLALEIRGFFIKTEMEDEIMQFHSIIIMLMYIERMDVLTILEWMEHFSFIFRDAIMECADHFTYDEEEALNELKEKEPFPPFVRIVENLEASDCVGIQKAFDEMSGQRAYYAEKRKQENEISISNRGVIGRLAAYTPLMLTVSLYLIVPFVMESVNQLMGYVTQLQVN